MGGFFSLNSPFYKFMSKLFDTMVISLVWSVSLVPAFVVVYFMEDLSVLGVWQWLAFPLLMVIATILIGPATTALYYTVVKAIRRDRGYVTKEFLKSFKLNFKQASIVGSILSLFFSMLFENIDIVKASESANAGFFWYFYIALIFFFAMISMYVFPVLSRYTVTIRNLFKMCFFLSIRHLLTTIVSLVIFAVGFIGCFFTAGVGLVILPGACVLLTSLLMEKVLKRYLPEEETELNEDGEEVKKDEWFRE